MSARETQVMPIDDPAKDARSTAAPAPQGPDERVGSTSLKPADLIVRLRLLEGGHRSRVAATPRQTVGVDEIKAPRGVEG